jgi:diguanylate cyclase (GGDEF)-like protein/PAS domain S-box-containing protein
MDTSACLKQDLDFQAVFAATASPYLILNPALVIVEVNDALLQASMKRRDELLGKYLFDAFPQNPDDPEADGVANLHRSFLRVLQHGVVDTMEVQKYDIPIGNPKGGRFEARYWKPINTPLFDGNGELTHILHQVEDITSRVRSEKALRESQRRFRALINATADVIYCMSPDWKYMHELDGRGFLKDTSGLGEYRIEDYVHPDDLELGRKTIAEAIRNKTVFELEHRVVRADGSYGWTYSRAVPLLDSSGEIQEWIGTAVDITERKAAEEQLLEASRRKDEFLALLRESERQFRLMADSIPQMVWIADGSGRVIFFNQQWSNYTGAVVETMPAEEVTEKFLHPDDGAHTLEVWDKAQQTGQIFKVEHRIRSAAGQYRWFLVRAEPYRDTQTGEIVRWFGTSTDVHDSKIAEVALKQSEERYRSLFESIDEGFCIIEVLFDRSGNPCDYRFCEVNPMFEQQTGLHNSIGKTARELVQDVEEHWITIYGRVAVTGEPIRVENEAKGLKRWFEVYAFCTGEPDAKKVGVLVKDITDRKQAEQEIRHASLHDSLTGLPNRAMLNEYASHLLPHNSRNNQSTAVLFFDLDRFKPINDTHGHDIGDIVLKEVANRIRRCVRAGDVAVRFGGDEFVVLLHDIKAVASAAETTRHIVASINEPYHVGDLSLSLSASVGISVFPADGMDIGTLISNADMAMYQAKQSGRNNFQFYSIESAAGTKLQAAIEQQLKSALSDDAFHLFYQPVVDVKTGQIVSVEALLRWRNTDIGPDQFVPIAEATGMINPIGRWLLEEASRQYKRWLDHGLQAIPIAVNVSVVEFRDKDFVSRFETVIGKHGINWNALQVEVTETAVMDDVEHAVTLLSRLKALGVTVLLDDFGTGHSSLAYLARLPLTKVKIDKSFIARLTTDIASRAVADAMIALGRTLNLEVVAEGIESQDALDYVYSHGCTQAQGYYLGKPMSGEHFESWYWAHRERMTVNGPAVMRTH